MYPGYVPIDNLRPPDLKEIEDNVLTIVGPWTKRQRLVALDYLYRTCGCRIGDIPHEIAKEYKIEVERNRRGET